MEFGLVWLFAWSVSWLLGCTNPLSIASFYIVVPYVPHVQISITISENFIKHKYIPLGRPDQMHHNLHTSPAKASHTCIIWALLSLSHYHYFGKYPVNCMTQKLKGIETFKETTGSLKYLNSGI
jgi:hypothetical protein